MMKIIKPFIIVIVVVGVLIILGFGLVNFSERLQTEKNEIYSKVYNDGQRSAKLKIPAQANPYTGTYARIWMIGYMDYVEKQEKLP